MLEKCCFLILVYSQLSVGQQDKERYLLATNTYTTLPDDRANIQRVLVYLPYQLRRCGCVHEDDDDNKIIITYENS